MISTSPSLPKRYSILRPLGHGGEGSVFLVRDAYLGGAFLTLKIIHERPESLGERPGTSGIGPSESPIDPLGGEFLVKSQLAHPALARVRDFGRLPGGGAFFTCDYAPGEDLLEWSLHHPFSANWSSFYFVAAQVLGALHSIHSAGFVHGDVKPAHIIVQECPDPSGLAVSLIDFGSARLAEALHLERRGTPAYLAPPNFGIGPETDLYSLGMSLFHGAIGRLPFSLGEEEELRAWRSAGRSARLEEWAEEIPPIAELLVERLTAPPGESRFHSAREALAFLERKTSGAYLPAPSPLAAGRLVGRDEELRAVLNGISEAVAPLAVIVSPPGGGKSRFLEECLRRSQLLGFRTVLVKPAASGRALEELKDLISEFPGGPPPCSKDPEELGRSLLDRIAGEQVLVGLDILQDLSGRAGREKWKLTEDAFAFRAWQAFARRYLERPPEKARVISATTRPDLIPSQLGSHRRIRELHLKPLQRDALQEMAVEFFRTAGIPGIVIDRLQEVSAGSPGRARAYLQQLSRSGIRTDLLGMLVTPRELPSAIPDDAVSGDAVPEAAVNSILDPLHRMALTIAAVSPGAIRAAEVARWAPLLEEPHPKTATEETWEQILEELYWEGHLLRTGTPGGEKSERYRLANASLGSLLLEPLGEEILERIRSRIFDDLKKEVNLPGHRDPDRLQALALAARAAGEVRLAARALGVGVRRLVARKRHSEALMLLWRILVSRAPGSFPERSLSIFSLRGGHLALLDGRKEEGKRFRDWLEQVAHPGVFPGRRARALILLAQLDEREGTFGGAVKKLEEALSILESRAESGNHPALWYEASALLATLHFATGRPDLGAPLLHRGKDLAGRMASISDPFGKSGASPPVEIQPPADDLPGCARSLSRFGVLFGRHGDATTQEKLIQMSLSMARDSGRDDLLVGPLHELAMIRAGQGCHLEAWNALSECQKLSEATGDRPALLRIQVNLATLCHKMGKFSEAERFFQGARILADELEEDGPSVAAWMGLEVILRDRGELLQALRVGRQILRRFPSSRQTLHATAHLNLGEIYLALGRPERARRERAMALAMARSCDYRFLIGYALLGLGATRFAVGDLSGAERRLRLALRKAEEPAGPGKAPDEQLAALANLQLGLVLAARSEATSALSVLGRAMCHARRASSKPNLDGALLAMVHLLLCQGKRERGRILLASYRRQYSSGKADEGASGRHRFLAKALEARAHPDWPLDLSRLEAAVEGARASGDVALALRILCEALRDPALAGSPPAQLLAIRESIASGFLRRSPERDRHFFSQTYGLGTSSPQSSPARESPAGTASAGSTRLILEDPPAGITGEPVARDSLARLAARWAAGGKTGEEEPARLEGELSLLREAIPVEALWVLNEPGSHEPMFYSAQERGPPLDLFSSRASLIESIREKCVPHWGNGFAALPAFEGHSGGKKTRRVFYVESNPDALLDPRLQSRIELAANLLGLFFRLRSSESARQTDRKRLKESLHEMHRLNALLAQGKGHVETAVITHRLIEVERREALEADRMLKGGLPKPTARSQKMCELMNRLKRVAADKIPILLIGENGTGKDLLARTIHSLSPWAKGPFISEVCAIPESLLESELFGFVRGAFTDAVEDRPGLLQLCHGGTLYLDEISDMPSELQARLLRILDEHQVRPIGAPTPVSINFRLIASSHRPLRNLRESGVLRNDFFWRISTMVLEIPPLRERREDIPVLVQVFADQFARERGVSPPEIEPDLMDYLSLQEWPGNVRQLENAVRRALILHPEKLERSAFQEIGPSAGELDREEARGPLARRMDSPSPPLRAARKELERRLIAEALTASGGNASKAARSLGITRRYLGTLLEKYRIRLSDFIPRGR